MPKGRTGILANRLFVKTVLGPPPDDFGDDAELLLSRVEGVEGISQPFSYALTMVRPRKRKFIAPDSLINTRASFGIKLSIDQDVLSIVPPRIAEVELRYTYIVRHGIISHFEYVAADDSFFTYQATMVSGFQMLSNEVVYRVFEGQDVVQIINSVINGYKNLNCNMDYLNNAKAHDSAAFPKMEICFQYGESTFNFLSRLMTRFGIWYYFEQDAKLTSEVLVLRTGPAQLSPCGVSDDAFNAMLKAENIPLDQLYSETDAEASVLNVANPSVHYLSAPAYVRTRTFNPLVPTSPIKSNKTSNDAFDLLAEDVSPGKSEAKKNKDPRFQINVFPGPAGFQKEADADVLRRIEQEEAQVFVYGGDSKNPALQAGRTIKIKIGMDSATKGGTADLEWSIWHPGRKAPEVPDGSQSLILSFVHFQAYESSYGHHFWSDLLAFGKSIGSQVKQFILGGKGIDLTLAATAGGLNNYIKAVQQNANQNALVHGLPQSSTSSPVGGEPATNVVANHSGYYGGTKGVANLPFGDYFGAGALAAITTVLTGLSLSGAIDTIVKRHADDFSCSFGALLPWAPVPLPGGGKPAVPGPHLALVVGQYGTKPDPKGQPVDFKADTLGRVRIRFPWDPGPPPHDKSNCAPTWESSDSEDPYASDRNTCWVRVAEGWAGHAYGTQFMPRVGDEVIVDFLGGDPDRPIITGRVYNADRQQSNLPLPSFDPTNSDKKIVADDNKNYLLDPTIAPPYTRSGIKTRLTPGGNGFHLLRFEDNADAPQLLLRSQGRFDVTALCSRYETTLGNRHVKVTPAKDKNGNSIGGNSFTSVGGECDVHIGGARCEQVEKNYELTVKADTLLDLEGKFAAVVSGAASLAADSIVLQATTKITLKVGGSSIVLTPCAIYLNGPVLHHNAGDGGADSADPVTLQNVAGAQTADDGTKYTTTPTDCGDQGGGQGGGGRGTHTASPKDPLQCTSDPIDPANIEIATEGPWPTQ